MRELIYEVNGELFKNMKSAISFTKEEKSKGKEAHIKTKLIPIREAKRETKETYNKKAAYFKKRRQEREKLITTS